MNASTQTFGICFVLRNNKTAKQEALIHARITVDGKRAEFSLKRNINPVNWNQAKGCAKGNKEEFRSLNNYLEQVRRRIFECREELLLDDQVITPVTIKNLFLGSSPDEKKLSHLFDYHTTISDNHLAIGTIRHYGPTRKYLFDFLQEKRGANDISIKRIDYKFLVDFEMYIRSKNGNDPSKPMCNNTAMKHLCRLRKLINLAIKLEWIDRSPFRSFSLRYDQRERGFLSTEQLQAIEEMDFKTQRLSQVRDMFIFSCYTGISFCDIMKLKTDNVSIGIDGYRWIVFKRQKTATSVKIPLFDKADAILNNYLALGKEKKSEYCFPRISNQKTNIYLKEVADHCGLDLNLTFHMARHTFATTITLSNGLPIETVSKLLGHTKIATTQIYAKVVEEKISNDVNNLRSKMNEPKLKIKNMNC